LLNTSIVIGLVYNYDRTEWNTPIIINQLSNKNILK
jgi:hypothetical protein